MDSLLANYASSDEEEEKEEHSQQQNSNLPKEDYISKTIPKPTSGLFSSLPPPKSTFVSPPQPQTLTLTRPSSPIRQPKHEEDRNLENSSVPPSHAKTSSLFSSLPQPKSSSLFASLPPVKSNDPAPVLPNPKKVVQFRPPINPPSIKSDHFDDDDDDDEDENEKQKKKLKESESTAQTSSVKSFLSSIPAPKNSVTLGVLPSASGSGRRSILETDASASNLTGVRAKEDADVNSKSEDYYESYSVNSSSDYAAGGSGDFTDWVSGSDSYVNYEGNGNDGGGVSGHSNWGGQSGNYSNYDGGHANYAHYEGLWSDGSASVVTPEVSELTENTVGLPGKRGRRDAPQEIVEVKQDELIKNRPREDQVRLTGIAFGPSYQPASTKGKPSKLHKRKHQIGSLFFDMKQKEMELAERRAKGFLTKAQTQLKYGW